MSVSKKSLKELRKNETEADILKKRYISPEEDNKLLMN